jgi:radical SAM protein with 4Fe4S-binding SPASM domain
VREIQEACCATTRGRIRHGIQTNLSLLAEEHLGALRSLGLASVGTSYDPEPGIRGPRHPADPLAHARHFLRGVALLEREGMNWGLIYVVTRLALGRPREIFQFLANLNPACRVTLNPVLFDRASPGDLAIEPLDFAEFLGAVAAAWWDRRARYGSLEPLASLSRPAARPAPAGPGEAPTDSMLNVEPDGVATPCRRPAAGGAVRLGNLADTSLAELCRRNAEGQRAERERKLREAPCGGCRYWTSCRAGCSLDPFAQAERTGEVGPWCRARLHLMKAHLEPLMEGFHDPCRA